MSVVAILSLGSVACYRSFVTHHELINDANTLISALRFARSEAISTGGLVVVCPSGFSEHECGRNWSDGLLVFAGVQRKHLLRVFPAFAGVRVLFRSQLGFNEKIVWGADGFTRGEQGSFWLARVSCASKLQIILLQSGRLRMVL